MANSFKRFLTTSIGTSPTAIGSYTVPSNNTATIIGLSVSNLSNITDVDVSVNIDASGVDYFIVKGAPIPIGGALVVIGGDQKVVLEAGDSVEVTSNVASSVDAVMSILESTL